MGSDSRNTTIGTAKESSENVDAQHQVTWDILRKCLLLDGERMESADLEAFFGALVGGDRIPTDSKELFGPQKFAEHILGFEDFNSSSSPMDAFGK